MGGLTRNEPGCIVADMELTIVVPETSELGPAMQALQPRQRSFVYALVECGGNYSEAAAAAGYGSESKDPATKAATCRVAGHRLAHHPAVLAAIKEEAERRLQSALLIATSELVKMAQDPFSKHQYKAAVALLDRGGMPIVHRQEIDVRHTKSDQEIRKEVLEFCKVLNLDPQRLLGHVATDAEFEVVTSAGSAEGLEDVL